MMALFARYDFLLLALLFCLPPLFIAAARPDLRPLMRRAALLALPFALTERFFYPDYWSPTFLFDLIDQLGFGLEDLLFVAAFGAFAATAYPALARRQIVAAAPPRPRLAATLIAGSIATALLLHAAGLPMYGATITAELVTLAAVLRLRPDLALPALVGGLFVTAIYAIICLVYAALLPGIFDRVWHTEALFDRTLAAIPLEELLYGLASGALATAVLPVVLRGRWERRA
jgi:hypothetical protein